MARKVATQAIQTEIKGNANITIPYLFYPRSYQVPVFKFIENGGKRAITVWHRRAGKDICWLNIVISEMLRRPFCGTYFMIYPKLSQGRRDAWDAKANPESGGQPFRAHFPPELVMESSETEMQLTLRPLPHQKAQAIPDGRGGRKTVGSIFQIMGADKDSMDNLRGVNVAGAVFSEYSEQNKEAWEMIIEPVLVSNGGWAAFDFTPKGKNHAYDLYMAARNNPKWFTSVLNIEQTKKDAPGESGEPITDVSEIVEMRKMGRAEAIIQQEYYCAWEGFLKGTIYGDLIVQARSDGRITRVPCHSAYPVGAIFDIGRSDGTAIWLYQRIGEEIRFIDYIEDKLKGADYYAHVLRVEKPYVLCKLILPHDARMKGFSAVQSTEEFFRKTVCRRIEIAEKTSVQAGIDMVRRAFSRFVFDEVKCARGIECLEKYRRNYDEQRKDYSGEPVHDEYSHGADAVRHGVVGGMDKPFEFMDDPSKTPVKAETDFRVFEVVQ